MLIVFKLNRFYPNVWTKRYEDDFDHTGIHTNYILVIFANPNYISEKFMEVYMFKYFGTAKIHLGCDYRKVRMGATTRWIVGWID